MRTGQSGAERVLADRRENAGDLIGDHGAAVADAIDENRSIDLAATDGQRRGIGEIRKIAGIFVVGTEIDHLVAGGFELLFDLQLQAVAGVVVCHRDSHSALPFPYPAETSTAA